MADPYRYPEHDRNRRGSSPGWRWDRDRLPPNRPASPQRSHSCNMDPRGPRDPRQPNYNSADPRKRNASQSPDGAQARKQQKPDTRQGNGIAQGNQADPRRASIPNGALNGPRPSAGIQPASAQRTGPPPPPAKPGDGVTLSSPRSPHGSMTSGRSTPQQQQRSGLSKDVTAQPSNGTTGPDSDPQSLSNLLVKFSSDIASRAALEHGRNQAQALLSIAKREYSEMTKHFKAYPAIEERKNIDKKVAQEALSAKEKLLSEHTVAQQAVTSSLASLIGQLATPKPDPNLVPRAEFEALQRDLSHLRNELASARRIADQAISQVAQVSSFQKDVQQLYKNTGALLEWKTKADPRIKDVEERATATNTAFNDFRSNEVTTLATNQQILKLENDLNALRKAQAEAAAKALNSQATNKVADPWSDERFQKLSKGFDKHEVDITQLQQGGLGVIQSFESSVKAAMQKEEAVSKKMESLESRYEQLGGDIVDSKEAINTIRDSIEEEGKDPIVKRVKRLDMLVNNLSSKLSNGGDQEIATRISQLEKDHKDLQGRVQASKNTLPSQPGQKSSIGPAVAGNATSTLERLSNIEADVSSLFAMLDTQHAALQEGFDNTETILSERFTSQISEQVVAIKEELQPLRDSIKYTQDSGTALAKTVSGLGADMHSKATTESVELLKGELSTVSGDVKKLQAHTQRAKSISQQPTPVGRGPQPNGVIQNNSHPQQLPNGGAQMNSPHPPRSPYAAPYPPGQQAQNAGQQDLQLQINGLVVVTQQLKMRCDNLQTDDVVRAMLDQFNSLYPDAKSINAAIQGLRNSIGSIQQQVSILQQKKQQAPEPPSEEIKKAAAKAEGANQTAHGVSQRMQVVRGELNALKEQINALETKVTEKTVNSDSDVTKQLQSLRADLDIANATAVDAERLSKGHASRFSKILPEELKRKIATLESTVEEHAKKFSSGESTLSEMKLSFGEVMKQMKKNVAGHKVRLERLEDGAESDI